MCISLHAIYCVSVMGEGGIEGETEGAGAWDEEYAVGSYHIVSQ